MQLGQDHLTRRNVLSCHVPSISDSFNEEVNDPPFLKQMAEGFRSDFMTVNPFVRSCFGGEVRYLPGENWKFRDCGF